MGQTNQNNGQTQADRRHRQQSLGCINGIGAHRAHLGRLRILVVILPCCRPTGSRPRGPRGLFLPRGLHVATRARHVRPPICFPPFHTTMVILPPPLIFLLTCPGPRWNPRDASRDQAASDALERLLTSRFEVRNILLLESRFLCTQARLV